MNALLFLALTALAAVIVELLLWRLFLRSVTPVHFAKPLAPAFIHVSSVSHMGILAVLHLSFTIAMLCISYVILW
jgi:hypothetical protein